MQNNDTGVNFGNFNLRSQIFLGDLDGLLFEMFSRGPLTGGLKTEGRGGGQPGAWGGSVVRCSDSRRVRQGESWAGARSDSMEPFGSGRTRGGGQAAQGACSCPECCVATPGNA